MSADAHGLFDLERLEGRVFLSAAPDGFSPIQIRQAYGFTGVTYQGKAQTIAIVDAYSDPNIASDLHTFDVQFGLPDNVLGKSVLTVATPEGKPGVDASWGQEISLDVEWAHAIAPKASILLVETRSSSESDLLNGVNYAREQSGVVAVSMSWASSETSDEQSDDHYFTTPAGHIGGLGRAGGITFVDAAGDNAGLTVYPAASPNVLGVGGTTLTINANGSYGSEKVWSDSGGGSSNIEGTTDPEVVYNGDPNTGYAIYDSLAYQGASGWQVEGGTSAGAPQWAALVALADQGRELAGGGSLDGPTQTVPAILQLPSSDFHGVSSAVTSRGRFRIFSTQIPTGRGSPVANLLIPALMAVKQSWAIGTGNTSGNSSNGSLPGLPFALDVSDGGRWDDLFGREPILG